MRVRLPSATMPQKLRFAPGGAIAVAFVSWFAALATPAFAQSLDDTRRMLGGLPDDGASAAAAAPSAGPAPTLTPGPSEVLRSGLPSTANDQTLPVPLEGPINPDEYMVGRGDQLQLALWGKQNLQLPIVVDAEGRAFVPRLGYIDLNHKTLTQARVITKKLLARYYPKVDAELSLVSSRSF